MPELRGLRGEQSPGAQGRVSTGFGYKNETIRNGCGGTWIRG
jgi:hypothetical protein